MELRFSSGTEHLETPAQQSAVGIREVSTYHLKAGERNLTGIAYAELQGTKRNCRVQHLWRHRLQGESRNAIKSRDRGDHTKNDDEFAISD